MPTRHLLCAALALAGVAVAALGLAGCESKDDDTLTVALTGQYPPFSTYDENGNLEGFDVDVARAIAAEMGREVEFVATKWDAMIPGLQAGKYDAIIGSMAVTPEREKAVSFSEPYYRSGAQLYVHERHAEEIQGIADCAAKPVGVVRGETYQHYLEQNRPDVNVRTYGGTPEIFQEVSSRRLVGFVSDRLVGLYQIEQAGEPFVPVGDLLYAERMAIPVHKDRPELLREINAALQAVKESGKLDEIHRKWFGRPPGGP